MDTRVPIDTECSTCWKESIPVSFQLRVVRVTDET